MMENMMADNPANPCNALGWHFKSSKNPASHISPEVGVTMGGNASLFVLLCCCWLADIMKQGDPEQVGITISRAEFNRQPGVNGNITFAMIFWWLQGARQKGQLRDCFTETTPPACFAQPQFFFKLIQQAHFVF